MMKNAIMGLCKEIGINSVWMKEIEININKTQLTKVTSFANMLLDNSSKDKCLSLLKEEKNNEFEISNEMYNLIVFLCSALVTREKYREKKIHEHIFYETFKDIKIWSEVCFDIHGKIGLMEINWLIRHINLQIFRLGRLQFEMTTNSFDIKNNIFMPKDKVISVHIPAGEKLSYEECRNSYELAGEFFKKYFPDFEYKGFYCYSWLLDKRLENILDASSNILKFQSDYEVLHTDDNLDEIKKRIFGYVSDDLSQYPQDTSIRRRFINYVQNGGKLGNSYGYLKE